MEPWTLYQTYREAYFLERPNRFVMRLETKNRDIISAHIPNPGRMTEFCVTRHPFFVTPVTGGKYAYKVISTLYQDEFVLLDTIKANALFGELLQKNLIPQFQNVTQIRREVAFDDSTFDFTFIDHGQSVIVEIKSCSLCHNRLAMFPDAPTLRGQRHLNTLERVAREGSCRTHIVYLIVNAGAQRFLPDFHTDFDYGTRFLSARYVQFAPLRVKVLDPITVDLESVQAVPVDRKALTAHCHDKGSYLLLLENPENVTVPIGKLGSLHFRKGWYVYAGSAMNGLNARLKRHQRKRKKLFWHIDYIASTVMKVKKVFPIRRADRIESQLAHTLQNMSDAPVKGFGASDTSEDSHLFYFASSPIGRRDFVDMLFTARTVCSPVK